MKVKTSELTGAALDWAVAKCEGVEFDLAPDGYYTYRPSMHWAQGGPIIGRERISLREHNNVDGYWTAMKYKIDGRIVLSTIFEDGPTHLIAAMRCYVGSKLGNEVEVPDELVSNTTEV